MTKPSKNNQLSPKLEPPCEQRLYLHVGLPKTATSSLQRLFPKFDGILYDYHGAHIGEAENNSELYKAMFEYCVLNNDRALDRVEAQLGKALRNSTRPSLLSDEIFSTDGVVTWQEKMKRLATVTKHHEVVVFFTVRHPIDAAFSLYVQNYHIIRKGFPDFSSFVANSNNIKIFQYAEFLTFMEALFGSENIKILRYETLRSDQRMFFSNLFSILGQPLPEEPIELGHENVKRKTEEGVFTERNHPIFSLIRLGQSPFGRIVQRLPGVQRLALTCVNLLKRLPLRGGSTFIPNLTDDERDELKAKLQQNNDLFFEKTGIDYR